MEDSPAQWTRETTWRQGQVLPATAAASLGLVHKSEGAMTCVVVVSHDCDLANDNLAVEPEVEVIVGRLAEPPNGNFRWGKAPRTLHLDMTRNGEMLAVELVATDKRLVHKSRLAALKHDPVFELTPKALQVLRTWLAVRYNRAAFPDAFVNRMNDHKLDTKLVQALEPFNNLVSAVFFQVDGGNELMREDGSPYELDIVLSFEPGADPEDSADRADEACQRVQQMFENRCFDKASEAWSGVQLKRCVSISEDDLRVSRAKLLTQWRLEYMSMRDDSAVEGPLPP